jgi:ElaB/YqjD/DUF883 family membrane-anchored ribosome-binding protein
MNSRISEYLPSSWFKRPVQSAGDDPTVVERLKAWSEPVEQFVVKHPGASLAIAITVGVTIAWWLKRR